MLGEELLDLRGRLVGRSTQQRAHLFEDALLLVDQLERPPAGRGLEPAHPRRDAALAADLHEPDVPGPLHVGPATELHREVAHPDDTDLLAVLLTEKRERPRLDGVRVPHLVGPHLGVRPPRRRRDRDS